MPRKSPGDKNLKEGSGSEEDPFYEVEKLLEHKVESNRHLFLVKWKPAADGKEYDNTWEPFQNLSPDMKQVARRKWPQITHPKPLAAKKGTTGVPTAASAKAAVKSAFSTSTPPAGSKSSQNGSASGVNGSQAASSSASKSSVYVTPKTSPAKTASPVKSDSNSAFPSKSPVKSPMKNGSQSSTSIESQSDSSVKESEKGEPTPILKRTGGDKSYQRLPVKRPNEHAYSKKKGSGDSSISSNSSGSQKKARTNGSQATGDAKAKKRTDYLSWDEYFMSVAQLSAQRSKDPNTQVGACIVNRDKKIVAIGYNGMPIGLSDDEFPWSKTGPFLEKKYAYVCHAEMNSIMNRNSADLTNCTLYVGLFPCNECVKLIIQSRISNVVYLSDKNAEKDETKAAKIMLKAANINVRRFVSQREFPVVIPLQVDE